MVNPAMISIVQRQLSHVLPVDLAAALARGTHTPRELAEGLALLRGHLQTMLPLLPRPIVQRYLESPRPAGVGCERWAGSLLFADLSGFTALSEQLSALGREGSEVITGVINQLFAGLTSEVERYGGWLLKFGGDALTAFFAADALGSLHAPLAAAAAQGIQERMASLGQIETKGGRHTLRLRIGIHSGTIVAAQLGDESHMELLITGRDINQVAQAQNAARPGEVVTSAATMRLLDGANAVERADGFFGLAAFNPPPPIPPAEPSRVAQTDDMQEAIDLAQAIASLERFLPQGFRAALLANEQFISGFRSVTTLFAHVAPISDLLELVPSDDLAATILNAYYCRMQQAIQRFGGSINKLDLAADGDKLLACFGAPIAQEHHQEWAARAALAMQQGLQAVNQDLADLPYGLPPLRQRIGINTGHVFAGLVGTQSRREYTVMGDAVNVSARLMGAASDGAIWISPTTQRQVSHLFAGRNLQPIMLKGKAEPIEPWEITEAFDYEHRRQSVLPQHLPLIGREEELAALRAAAARALGGQGETVIVLGEPGIGKSRLIEELLQELSLQSLRPASALPTFTLLSTECQFYEQQSAFATFGAILGQALRLPDRGSVSREQLVAAVEDRAAQLAPDLARFSPLLGNALGLEFEQTPLTQALAPEQRLERSLELIAALIAGAARRQPIVIFCDDIHWCDASSWQVLEHLAGHIGQLPVLILLGARNLPEFSAPDANLKALTVGELSASAGAQLIAAMLGDQTPADLAERLKTSDEGYNPFFVEELMHSLVETGVLVREANQGSWRIARDLQSVELPATIEEVITVRLDRLEAQQRDTLQVAAVIGRRFHYPILQGISDAADLLAHHLLALSANELVVQDTDTDYVFRHLLTRDVAYNSTLYARRRELHRGTAEQIERLYSDRLDDYYPILARHYLAAESWERALRASLEAGRAAQERYHNQEALTFFEMALISLNHLAGGRPMESPAAAIDIHERMGLVLLQLGRYEQAQASLNQALGLLRDRGEAETTARIYLHLATVLERRGEYEEAFGLVQQGLLLVERSDSETQTRLLLLGAGLHQRQGRFADALDWGQQGLTIAERHSRRKDTAHASYFLGGTYYRMGQNRAAIEMSRRSLELYQELGDLAGQANAHINLGNAYDELGAWTEARYHDDLALRLKKDIGDIYGQGILANNLGDLLRKMGDHQGAMDSFKAALQHFQSLGAEYPIAIIHMNIGAVSVQQADLAQAADHLARSEALFRSIGSEDFMAELYRAYAELALKQEQPQQALEAVGRSLQFARQLEARADEGAGLYLRGRILKILGDHAAALATLQGARAILEEVENSYLLAQCLDDLAALAEADEAAQLQARAADLRSGADTQPHSPID